MLSNLGLYAKSIVVFLADVGYLAQAAIADGVVEPSEWGTFVVGLLGAISVFVVPNAQSSDVPREVRR